MRRATLLLVGALAGSTRAACEFEFEDVFATFDLSSLQSGSPFQVVVSPTAVYQFAVCETLPTACRGAPTVAMRVLSSTSSTCVQSYGNLTLANTALAGSEPSAGVKVTYAGGNPCQGSTGPVPSTTLVVRCSESASVPSNFIVFDDSQNCALTVQFDSAAGCPKLKSLFERVSTGWVLVCIFVVLSAAYLVTGVSYKRCAKGSSGMESLPNIDGWRSFFGYVADGYWLLVDLVTCGNCRGANPDDVYNDMGGGDQDGVL